MFKIKKTQINYKSKYYTLPSPKEPVADIDKHRKKVREENRELIESISDKWDENKPIILFQYEEVQE